MRALAAFLLLLFSSTGACARPDCCLDSELAVKPKLAGMPIAGPAAAGFSSFKGIGLRSKSGDVAANSLKIGFTIYMTTFVDPSDGVASIDICRGDALVG